MQKLKIALIQMNSKSYALEYNLNLALKLALEAVEKKAQILVFPELFDSGYCVKDKAFALDFKKPHKNQSFSSLSAFALKHQIYIIACSIEKDKDKFYDSAYVIDTQGKLLAKQRKIYLWAKEKQRFQRGKKQELVELDFDNFKLKIGLGICYEIGFSELARALALKGAQILFYPSAFGKARSFVWDLASRARALENGLFVVACNRSGFEYENGEKLEFAGLSRIITPKAELLAQATLENECIVAELDLEQIKTQRKALPYLKDIDIKLMQNLLKDLKIHKKEKKWQKKF